MEEKRYCVNCGGELTKDKHGDWVHINGDKIYIPFQEIYQQRS